MYLVALWFSLAAYSLLWRFLIGRAMHAPERVLIGFFGGWIWLFIGVTGICWTAAAVYQWFRA